MTTPRLPVPEPGRLDDRDTICRSDSKGLFDIIRDFVSQGTKY